VLQVRSSDLKAYEYVHDVDGHLVEVLENGQSTWRYETDADGNVVRLTHYARSRSVTVNQRGIVESVGELSYVHDDDGFLARRADTETFEYDSLGRLTRVHRTAPSTGSGDGGGGRYDVRYYYDGLGRLAVRHETNSGTGTTAVTQYFYANLAATRRITHVHHSTTVADAPPTGVVIRYVYDGRGKLFAMQRSAVGSDVDELFYIGLDPFDSPIVVLNGVGSVVKQLTYDPLGACTADTAPEFNLLAFGFRGSVVDPTVRLVLTVEGQAYDPAIGRWTSPRYGRVLANVDQLSTSPELVGVLYRNDVQSWKYEPMIGQF
jgi:YD repeat-containing protein